MAAYSTKALLVLLMCVAFLGQAMSATVMPYHMMSMDMNVKAQEMSMMDHSSHHMNMNTADANTTEKSEKDDCCPSSCKCFAAGCANFIAIIKNTLNAPALSFSAKIHSNAHLVKSQQPTSLFRPPIFS